MSLVDGLVNPFDRTGRVNSGDQPSQHAIYSAVNRSRRENREQSKPL